MSNGSKVTNSKITDINSWEFAGISTRISVKWTRIYKFLIEPSSFFMFEPTRRLTISENEKPTPSSVSVDTPNV